MRVRIYGKRIGAWIDKSEGAGRWGRLVQEEYSYMEYDSETGRLLATGSEDFSPERKKLEMEERWQWTWDGKRRNKGGYRWFEDHGLVRFRKSEKAEVKRYLMNKFGAEVLQLR